MYDCIKKCFVLTTKQIIHLKVKNKQSLVTILWLFYALESLKYESDMFAVNATCQ